VGTLETAACPRVLDSKPQESESLGIQSLLFFFFSLSLSLSLFFFFFVALLKFELRN
jgi:hypothetical protein